MRDHDQGENERVRWLLQVNDEKKADSWAEAGHGNADVSYQ